MKENFVGTKYDRSAPYMTSADLTKAIRAELKQAVAEGRLPAAKYSVRKSDYAGGRSVTVTATGLENTPTRRSEEWFALEKQIAQVANAYNYDNSDVMTDYFDVNYYLHVNIE